MFNVFNFYSFFFPFNYFRLLKMLALENFIVTAVYTLVFFSPL